MRGRVRLLGWLILALAGCGSPPLDPSDVEIAFVRSYEDGTEQLRGFSPGSDDVALAPTQGAGVRLGHLGWSPDGSLLVFQRSLGELLPDELDELHLLDPSSEKSWLLTQGSRPLWSPIGLGLGFLRSEGEATQLHIIDLETHAERRIGTGTVVSFSWAPDGERLVIISLWPEHDSNESLYVIDVDTGDVTRIDPDPPDAPSYRPFDFGPAWSPDGSTIAFASHDRVEEDVYSRIFLIDPDGSQLEQAPEQFAYGAGWPRWSPIGDLAFHYWHFDAIAPSDSGIRIVGSQDLNGVGDVEWSPDGSSMAIVEAATTDIYDDSTRIRVPSVDAPSMPKPETVAWSDSQPAWRNLAM